MKMLDLRRERHGPRAPLLGGSDDLIVAEPVAVALVGDDTGPVPAATDLVDVAAADEQMGGMLTGGDPWVAEVVGADDVVAIAGGRLGVVEPAGMEPDIVADEQQPRLTGLPVAEV